MRSAAFADDGGLFNPHHGLRIADEGVGLAFQPPAESRGAKLASRLTRALAANVSSELSRSRNWLKGPHDERRSSDERI
jgi:Fe-S cluster assembly ATPase SufC